MNPLALAINAAVKVLESPSPEQEDFSSHDTAENVGVSQTVNINLGDVSASVSVVQGGVSQTISVTLEDVSPSVSAVQGVVGQFVTGEQDGVSQLSAAESSGTPAQISCETANTSSERPKHHPPATKMVVDAIRAVNWRNGVPEEIICKQIEKTYKIKMKKVKPFIHRALKQGILKGTLRVAFGRDKQPRYIIKERY